MSTPTDVLPPVVTVGGRSASELLAALEEQGVQLNQAARDLLADPRFPDGGEAVESAPSKERGPPPAP